MAREGLRTLVVGKRDLTPEVYASFEVIVQCIVVCCDQACVVQARYRQAKLSVADRADQVAAVVTSLEEDLELLCLTGVEDRLQVFLCLSSLTHVVLFVTTVRREVYSRVAQKCWNKGEHIETGTPEKDNTCMLGVDANWRQARNSN